jgi:hypothetical protein
MVGSLLIARRVWLQASRTRRDLLHTATVRIYHMEDFGLPGGAPLQEATYPPEVQPLIRWCEEVHARWVSGMQMLASDDPRGEEYAERYFQEIMRLLRDLPHPIPPPRPE